MSDAAPQPRWLRLPAEALRTLPAALAADRSPVEVALLLRQLGYGTGQALAPALERMLAAEGEPPLDAVPAERFWDALSRFFQELGWGRVSFQPLHAGVAALDAEGWAEADPSGAAPAPTCHLSTGVLAELLSRAAGQEVAVMEVECRSRGDARCRFLFGSAEALEAVYHATRAGQPLDAALQRLA